MKNEMRKLHRGYIVGNSVLASEVGSSGCLFGSIRYNPPCFEPPDNVIRGVGKVDLTLTVDGTEVPYSEMGINVKENTYPYFSASLEAHGVSFGFEAFAPITPHNSDDMFLPFILMSFSFENFGEKNVEIRLLYEKSTDAENVPPCFIRIGDSFGFGRTEKTIDAAKNHAVKAVFGFFDERSLWRNRLDSEKALAEYGLAEYEKLRDGLFSFVDAIPKLGDKKIREYVRWYTQAAVMLTKGDREGRIITMGYNELNQRDSFWTTFMHLMLFPDLERRMIEISAEHQSENGKIPTTLLPLIERYYDIDINEYFCLRIARYYRYYGDGEFLERFFENYKRSVDFLLTLDRDGDLIPEQDVPENPECFWGDWKDVSYISGRKLAPHFCLLWLAVLKEGAFLASELGEKDISEKYRAAYEKAYNKVNSPWDGTADGGMFAGDHYAEIWYDGVKRDFILEDQTVGIFFDVVSEDTSEKIWSALRSNECSCGIRETYPYRSGEDVWNAGGTYHNGGVWPWLMFCDLAGRYKHGRREEVFSFIEKLGYSDLEKPGDFRPNEYLDAESGANCGFEVQGWSSAVWAIEYVRRVENLFE